MKASKSTFLICSLLLGFCLIANSVLASCPDCYIDHKAMTAHGTSANGRPIVTVKLTGDWDTSSGHSDPRMYNAVRDAVRDWNSATDPATGRGAFYEFQFNDQTQSADNRNVNIRIVKMPADNKGPAYISGPAGGPYDMNLPADSAEKCSPAALIEKIKHELGHPQGLAHKEKGPGKCRGGEGEDSIMDATSSPNATCLEYYREIKPRDIQVSNDVDGSAFRQGNCKSRGEGQGKSLDLIVPSPTPTPNPSDDECHTYQNFDSYYVGEGACWHEYWTVMTFCDGYLVYFSQTDLDVHCY